MGIVTVLADKGWESAIQKNELAQQELHHELQDLMMQVAEGGVSKEVFDTKTAELLQEKEKMDKKIGRMNWWKGVFMGGLKLIRKILMAYDPSNPVFIALCVALSATPVGPLAPLVAIPILVVGQYVATKVLSYVGRWMWRENFLWCRSHILPWLNKRLSGIKAAINKAFEKIGQWWRYMWFKLGRPIKEKSIFNMSHVHGFLFSCQRSLTLETSSEFAFADLDTPSGMTVAAADVVHDQAIWVQEDSQNVVFNSFKEAKDFFTENPKLKIYMTKEAGADPERSLDVYASVTLEAGALSFTFEGDDEFFCANGKPLSRVSAAELNEAGLYHKRFYHAWRNPLEFTRNVGQHMFGEMLGKTTENMNKDNKKEIHKFLEDMMDKVKEDSVHHKLQLAAFSRDLESIQQIIESNKCDKDCVNSRDSIGFTPLQLALGMHNQGNDEETETCLHRNVLPIVQTLLTHLDLDVNLTQTSIGWTERMFGEAKPTPIMYAARHCDPSVVQALLNSGKIQWRKKAAKLDANNGVTLISSRKNKPADIIHFSTEHENGIQLDWVEVLSKNDFNWGILSCVDSNSKPSRWCIAKISHRHIPTLLIGIETN